MYAILRQYTYDIAMIADVEEALTVAQGLHAAQPGYAGSIVAADGQRFIAVNLWRTEDDASAGRGAIGAPSAAAPQAADDTYFPAACRRRSGSKRSWKPVHHPGHYHVR